MKTQILRILITLFLTLVLNPLLLAQTATSDGGGSGGTPVPVSAPTPLSPAVTSGGSGGGGGGSVAVISPTREELREELIEQIRALREMIRKLSASRPDHPTSSIPEVPGIIINIGDPGQQDTQVVPFGVLVPYAEITLSTSSTTPSHLNFASVILTLQRRGFLYEADPELYLGYEKKIISEGPFKLNSWGQALVGPIHVSADRKLHVTVYAKLDASRIGVRHKMDPPVMAFDVTGISVDGNSTVQKTVEFGGRFPILGATHTIDTSAPAPRLEFSTSSRILSQSIAKDVPRQLLGGFKAVASGEESTHDLLTFWVEGNGANVSMVTGVELVNEEGVTVAGPVDISAKEGTGGYLYFRDTVLFPVGEHHYFLKGKVGQAFAGSLITFSLPDTQSWPARGQTTGHLFFPSGGSEWGPSMTVLGGSKVRVSVNSTPASKVVAGTVQYEGLQIVVDATQAVGDIGISVFGGLGLGIIGGRPEDVTSVQLYDGATAINTGSNVLNPFGNAIYDIIPDDMFITPVGTTKTLTLRFNTTPPTQAYLNWNLYLGGIKAVDLTTGARPEVEVISGQGPLIQVVRELH